jgi:excisionase family DNA binding protein
MTEIQEERATLTITEAARRLGISKNGAYRAASKGEIPAIRIGKRLIVPRVAFEKMLEAAQ